MFQLYSLLAVLDSYPVLFYRLLLMIPKISKINFPVWQYLNQSLFNEHCPAILSPSLYFHFYQVRYLDKCWSRLHRPEERFRN